MNIQSELIKDKALRCLPGYAYRVSLYLDADIKSKRILVDDAIFHYQVDVRLIVDQ